MGKINEQLDALFGQWKECFEKNGLHSIVKDGILLKRENINRDVEEEWIKSPRRILFLMKDHNQSNAPDDSADTRYWIRWNDDTANIKQESIHKIANLLYGLSNADHNEDVCFESLDYEKVKTHFNTYPFAIMECKKEPGGPKLTNAELSRSMNRDKEFIIKEIEILKPNIIICFGYPIYNFFKRYYGEHNLKKYGFSNGIVYCHEHNVIIFRVSHPSDTSGYYKHYSNSMYVFRQFLKTEDGQKFLGK